MVNSDDWIRFAGKGKKMQSLPNYQFPIERNQNLRPHDSQSTMTYIDTSSMIEQAQEAAESETVKRIKPIWTGGDSLLAMYQSRFQT